MEEPREAFFSNLRALGGMQPVSPLTPEFEATPSQKTLVDARADHWLSLFGPLLNSEDTDRTALSNLVNALIGLELACARVDWALRVHNNNECPEFVYHYTKKATFDDAFLLQLRNMKKGDEGPFLRLHPAESLNDPREGGLLYECLKESPIDENPLHALGFFDFAERNRNLVGLSHGDPTTFLASFCQDWDSLNLWRLYGGEGGGACIGFPARSCFQVDRDACEKRNAKNEEPILLPLYKIRYGKERTREYSKPLIYPLSLVATALKPERLRRERLRQETWRATLAILNDIAYFFKADAYAEEREFRVVHREQGGLAESKMSNDGTLYFNSGIPVFCRPVDGTSQQRRSITLGPQYSKNAGLDQVKIRRSLDSCGYGETTTIYLSQHTYRTNLHLKE